MDKIAPEAELGDQVSLCLGTNHLGRLRAAAEPVSFERSIWAVAVCGLRCLVVIWAVVVCAAWLWEVWALIIWIPTTRSPGRGVADLPSARKSTDTLEPLPPSLIGRMLLGEGS